MTGDFTTSVLRVALGADVRVTRYFVFAEIADAIGTRGYALGEPSSPEFFPVPYRLALTVVIGFRGRLLGASR